MDLDWRHIVVAASVAGLLPACLVSSKEAECDDLACVECADTSGCGYCDDDNGRCLSGTILGPDEGTACDLWRWSSSECQVRHDQDAAPPIECDVYVSCEACIADASCGFCLDGAECRALDHPSGCDLITDADDCDRSDCDFAVSCLDCVTIEGCGYCGNTEECRPLDALGQCEAILDDQDGRCDPFLCRNLRTCGECTSIRGCAYCPETDECSSSLPLPCWDLIEDGWNCPLEACEDAADCDECWGAGCSWCDISGGFCHERADGLCEPLYDFPEGAPALGCPPPNDCYLRETCRDCTSTSACGWCTDPVVVEPGTGICLAAAGAADYGIRCFDGFDSIGLCR